MLNAVIRLALHYRSLVLAACLVVLVYGGYLTTEIPIDVFPDLDRPRVVILTECPGLSSEEVETLSPRPSKRPFLVRQAWRPSVVSLARECTCSVSSATGAPTFALLGRSSWSD